MLERREPPEPVVEGYGLSVMKFKRLSSGAVAAFLALLRNKYVVLDARVGDGIAPDYVRKPGLFHFICKIRV